MNMDVIHSRHFDDSFEAVVNIDFNVADFSQIPIRVNICMIRYFFIYY